MKMMAVISGEPLCPLTLDRGRTVLFIQHPILTFKSRYVFVTMKAQAKLTRVAIDEAATLT